MKGLASLKRMEGFDELTLEERLHEAHDAFMLLGDLFELLAIGPHYVRGEVPSAGGCQTARSLCRMHATHLRRTLDHLPAMMGMWSSAAGHWPGTATAAASRPQPERDAAHFNMADEPP